MKLAIVVLGLTAATMAAARADSVIVQKVEGAGQSGQMTVEIKGTLIRTDISPTVTTLTDTATGTVTTLLRPQKVYIQMSAQAMAPLLRKMRQQPEPGPAAATATLEATGHHEKVNGYDTEVYVVRNGALKTSYWIARDYPDAARLLGLFKQLQNTALSAMAREMAPQPAELPGVPVKTEMETAPGRKITTTLISVKEQALPDADFAIPPGFKALPAPSFGAPSPASPSPST